MKHINKNIIAKTKNAIERCVRKKYPRFSLEWKNFLNKPLNYRDIFYRSGYLCKSTQFFDSRNCESFFKKVWY